VAEPKREEEKIFSYDTGGLPSSEPSVLGDDPPPGGSGPGEESDLAVQVPGSARKKKISFRHWSAARLTSKLSEEGRA